VEKIGILGTGNVGATLGKRLLLAGKTVVFGSRATPSVAAKNLLDTFGDCCQVTTIADAARQADTLILAAPWRVSQQVIETAGKLAGKTLIDCTNPLTDRFDGLTLGFDSSAAEQIALWAPDAHVVKAFNTVSVATMDNPVYDGKPATLFYCGDDAAAKQVTHRLVEAVGLEPIDAGPLQNARYLEPLAMLYIHLAVHQRMGGNTALRMMRR
jgi:8-hydroxy-5-deazaflavin:NADPH oxidoreductase